MSFLLFFVVHWAGAEESRLSLAPERASEIVTPLPADLLGKKYSGEWWMETGALGFSEGKDDGTSAAFKAAGRLNYRLAPAVDMVVDGELRAYSSRVQARYDDGLYQSGPRIKEFYMAIRPLDHVEVRVGALNQRRLKSSMLVAEKRSFPGISEGLQFSSESLSLGVFAQQTVPTSYSMNVMREDREKTPTFLTETVEIAGKLPADTQVSAYTTHFRFNNLPSIVAFESSQMGNSVLGDVAPNSEFRYGFEGFVAGTEVCWCLTGPISFRGGGQWLQNMKAPERSNRAQSLFLGTDLRVSQIEIKPRYTIFFNESDTTPGYYNGADVGHNNRKGFAARMDVNFAQYGFQVALEYGESQLINSDPFQAPIQRYFIGVETSHVPF